MNLHERIVVMLVSYATWLPIDRSHLTQVEREASMWAIVRKGRLLCDHLQIGRAALGRELG